MSETKLERSKRLKMAVIMGHRKRLGLCIKCGKEIHEGECIEIYDKADNRKNETEKITDSTRKKYTVISYRRRKNFCIKCGKEIHEGECIEIYDQVDNRPKEIQIEKPIITLAPKFKATTILNDIKRTKKFRISLEPDKEIKLQRKFIVLDIRPSSTGKKIEFSCLQQLSVKFFDYIICIAGRINQWFVYSDELRIKKLINIHELSNQTEQEIVNYICSSCKYFGFDDRYTELCLLKKIPFYTFMSDKNATSTLIDVAYKI